MSDAHIRQLARAAASGDPDDAERHARAARRLGLHLLRVSNYGNGNGYGYGYGYGYGNSGGSGYGYDGNGNGNGYGNGGGKGNGYGGGSGYGKSDGKLKEYRVEYLDYFEAGSPGVVRSYVSGIFAARLVGGSRGTIVVENARWLRHWENVGGEGSIHDLIASDVVPNRRGPMMMGRRALQQADWAAITEEQYARLVGGK